MILAQWTRKARPAPTSTCVADCVRTSKVLRPLTTLLGQSTSTNQNMPCLGCPCSRSSALDSAEKAAMMKRKREVPLCQTSASLNGSGRTRVPLHGVLGTTADGVTAYSNQSDSHWTNEKHYDNNLFMGYKWQCVEFARRWLWEAKRLYLPSKNCAYCFAGLKCVYKPVPGPENDEIADNGTGKLAVRGGSSSGVSTNEEVTPKSSTSSDANRGGARFTATDYRNVTWQESPCTYHSQGSRTAPVAGSLIIYPMSRGSPWGHIGVIVGVDLDAGLVYVADQNRFFGSWGNYGYSAAFRLDVEDGRHYIRDPESECKGWLVC